MVGLLCVRCSGGTCSGADCLSTDGGGDVNVDGAPDSDVVVPPSCDLSADLPASPSCIDDGIGIFVDATSGDDTNPGTRARPVKTIGAAVGIVGAKPRIYVCEGTYAEDVSLTQSNAVSLYGGLACGTWTYSGKLPVVGKSTLALHIAGAQKPLVLSDLAFQSADATQPGESSIAALVTGSTDITLRRVRLRAGAGHDGAPGVTGSNWTTVAQSDPSIRGNSASGGTGGASHTCALCADAVQSTGGMGGNGGLLAATSGGDGAPSLQGKAPADGKGGASGCVAGDDGANASAAIPAPGATTLGKLSANGWLPTGGGGGPNGSPGQGGGGGGGTGGLSSGAGGGAGGGCGGCGGAGGKAGSGGGASVALAVMTSKVTVAAGDLGVGTPGAGGSGSAGQDGQPGGYSGVASSPGCAGGNGGTGAKGGSGGGGAGGIAIGVVYTDQAPVVDTATTITVPSSGGVKGTGGSPGVNDGLDGLAQPTLQVTGA
ncbi:MAG TPA: hypothetical protein VLM85_32200 [Polyangiaceae bacterium]|nr:hypothetical protein [Polyangiaceae bacterium]